MGNLKKADRYKRLLDVGMRTFSVIDNLYCAKLGTKTADLMVYPEVGDVEVFNFENLDTAYESGYKEGLNSVDSIKKLL